MDEVQAWILEQLAAYPRLAEALRTDARAAFGGDLARLSAINALLDGHPSTTQARDWVIARMHARGVKRDTLASRAADVAEAIGGWVTDRVESTEARLDDLAGVPGDLVDTLEDAGDDLTAVAGDVIDQIDEINATARLVGVAIAIAGVAAAGAVVAGVLYLAGR